MRLTGNDGRMKGKLKIEAVNNQATVQDILSQTKIDSVRSLNGTVLEQDELVNLDNDWVKVVLIDGKLVLPVSPRNMEIVEGAKWELCTKQQLKDF